MPDKWLQKHSSMHENIVIKSQKGRYDCRLALASMRTRILFIGQTATPLQYLTVTENELTNWKAEPWERKRISKHDDGPLAYEYTYIPKALKCLLYRPCTYLFPIHRSQLHYFQMPSIHSSQHFNSRLARLFWGKVFMAWGSCSCSSSIECDANRLRKHRRRLVEYAWYMT